MKVLVISHTYISKVGREKWRALVRSFDVDLKIIVPSVWKDYLFTIRYDEQRDEELAIFPRKIFFSGKEAAHFYASPSFMLGEFQPDILHVEEGTDAFSFYQALVAKKLFSRKTKSLFFTWMNWEKKLSFPFSFFERYNLSNSDAAIAGNSEAMEILRSKNFRKPITVMPLLGLDPELFYPNRNDALRSELRVKGFVFGFVGRFVPEKGILDLLAATARLKQECSLLLLGGGAQEVEIRNALTELGIADRVRIVSAVPHSDVPRYLNCMDALVLPSYTVPHWKEQFGQVLVQAMACEVPVIGSRHAEIPNVIGDAGLVFEERSIEGLARSMEMLMTNDGLRNDLKRRGRQRVLEHFTNTAIAQRTYHVYQSLLSE